MRKVGREATGLENLGKLPGELPVSAAEVQKETEIFSAREGDTMARIT